MARCTNSVEPVALASIVETLPGSWLCNVQSQPWPDALGCLGLVMRAAYVSGQLGGQEWVEVGSSFATSGTEGREARASGCSGGPFPACPAALSRNFEVAAET